MTDTNPTESLAAEGLPDVEDHPPGIDIETDEESMVAPRRDHAIAAGDDPAYPVTAAEERSPESVEDRAEREIPDVGAEFGVGGGVQGSEPRSGHVAVTDPDDPTLDREDQSGYVVGAFSAPPGTDLSTAVPVDDPLPEPEADEVVGGARGGGQVVEVDAGEVADGDVRRAFMAEAPEDEEAATSSEEAAVHVEDDDDVS